MKPLVTQEVASDLDTFVALSAILTGIDGSKLHPALDTHGTAQTYMDLVRANCAATYATLMGVFAANQGKPASQVGSIILQQSGTDVANLAKSIMLLWYLACWYDPTRLPDTSKFTVVSSDAYTQGWVWRVGQTHPMGYSTWRFGYWHQAPPSLSDFIGGGNA